jgi:hypothetical protein
MLYLNAPDLKTAGQFFPGFTAHAQETSSGLVTLERMPEAPAAPNLAIVPPVCFKAASRHLLKNPPTQTATKKDTAPGQAISAFKADPRIAHLYRRPHLRKYAKLDVSLQQTRRLTEAAKKNPALLKKLEREGITGKAQQPDAPRPSRPPRIYNGLRAAYQITATAKKIVSLKQLAPIAALALG